MPAPKGKILVIRGGAIGDFICTVPAIAALRERFPETHLEVLGYPHVARLALAAGLVDQVQSIEARALASFFARGGSLPPQLGEYFSSFALILSYLYDPDEIFRTNVGLCSKAQFLVGPHRPDEVGPLHATDAFLKPLERLAIFDADAVPHLRIPPSTGAERAAESFVQDTLQEGSGRAPGRWLALHPGSGSERKNWPEERWAALIGCLSANPENHLLLVGGEAEGDRLERLARSVRSPSLMIARHKPLPELAALLQQCAAYVGHDSGISHLAAAIGVPVLALWGETNPVVWGPRGATVQLLQAPQGLARLEVDAVFRALENLLRQIR